MVWAVLWMLPRSYLKRLGERQLALPACPLEHWPCPSACRTTRTYTLGKETKLSVTIREFSIWSLKIANITLKQFRLKLKKLQLHRTVNWHYLVVGKQPVRSQHATASTDTRMYMSHYSSRTARGVVTDIVSKLYLKYSIVDGARDWPPRWDINTMINVT